MRRAVAFLLACLPFAALACADVPPDAREPDDEEVDVAEDELRGATETFALYANPDHVPTPGCDVRTKLELWTTSGRRYARLTEELAPPAPGGAQCKLYVVPNKRTYRLGAAGDSCGSSMWKGTRRVEGAPHVLELTDHRTRRCRDLPPARIVVDETVPGFPGPLSTRRYSFDRTEETPAREVVLEGTLRRTAGIGGENTGTSLATAAGLRELSLDAGELSAFVDGAKARVVGVETEVVGVAIPVRTVVDVTSLVTCPKPGWLNCMPGPNVRLSHYCAADLRSWVEASCPGVSYAD